MAHFVRLRAGWQPREIGTGGVAAGAVELGASPRFGVEGRLMFGRFLEGSAPADPSIRNLDATSVLGVGFGFRFYPYFDQHGPWVGGTVGGTRTGALSRATFDARIGWDFRLTDGFRAGPFVGYMHVLQPDDSIRPDDARLAMFGLHGAFYSEPRPMPRTPPSEAVPARDAKVIECGPGCAVPVASHVLSDADRCPDEADDFVGEADEDGCPDNAAVKLVADELILNDRVYFDFGLARVKQRSWPLLRAVAKLIVAHPEFAVVHIHGHCDEIGDDAWNQVLSEDRAIAVRNILIVFGVPANRLATRGFGKTKPRALGNNDAARQENRRVEFLVERTATLKGGKP